MTLSGGGISSGGNDYMDTYKSKSNKVTAASVDKRMVSIVRDDFGLGLIKPLISIWKKLLT